jgi:hypothetical protein
VRRNLCRPRVPGHGLHRRRRPARFSTPALARTSPR